MDKVKLEIKDLGLVEVGGSLVALHEIAAIEELEWVKVDWSDKNQPQVAVHLKNGNKFTVIGSSVHEIEKELLEQMSHRTARDKEMDKHFVLQPVQEPVAEKIEEVVGFEFLNDEKKIDAVRLFITEFKHDYEIGKLKTVLAKQWYIQGSKLFKLFNDRMKEMTITSGNEELMKAKEFKHIFQRETKIQTLALRNKSINGKSKRWIDMSPLFKDLKTI